jgi:uncharacterized membrane-anchored protein
MHDDPRYHALSKVPEVTLTFWIIKVAATTLLLAALYYWTNISRVLLFWAAFILTRPLGATVGDFLDKPVNHGGLALSRPLASVVIAAFIVFCIVLLPQRPGRHPSGARA